MNTSVQQIPTSVDPQFKDKLNSINSYKQFVTKINIRLIQLNELGANPPLKLWDNQATKVSIKKDYLEYINSLNNRTFTPTQKAILDKMPDIFEEHNKNLELSKIESDISIKINGVTVTDRKNILDLCVNFIKGNIPVECQRLSSSSQHHAHTEQIAASSFTQESLSSFIKAAYTNTSGSSADTLQILDLLKESLGKNEPLSERIEASLRESKELMKKCRQSATLTPSIDDKNVLTENGIVLFVDCNGSEQGIMRHRIGLHLKQNGDDIYVTKCDFSDKTPNTTYTFNQNQLQPFLQAIKTANQKSSEANSANPIERNPVEKIMTTLNAKQVVTPTTNTPPLPKGDELCWVRNVLFATMHCLPTETRQTLYEKMLNLHVEAQQLLPTDHASKGQNLDPTLLAVFKTYNEIEEKAKSLRAMGRTFKPIAETFPVRDLGKHTLPAG